jgi:hypothetical protein
MKVERVMGIEPNFNLFRMTSVVVRSTLKKQY